LALISGAAAEIVHITWLNLQGRPEARTSTPVELGDSANACTLTCTFSERIIAPIKVPYLGPKEADADLKNGNKNASTAMNDATNSRRFAPHKQRPYKHQQSADPR
jgi:hypothetical protein